MQDVLIVAIIFGTIAAIVRWALDQRVRLRLIEKGLAGNSQIPPEVWTRGTGSSMLWGLILVFVGAAILVVELIPEVVSEEAVLGIALVAAGAAIIIYHIIADFRAKRHQMLHA